MEYSFDTANTTVPVKFIDCDRATLDNSFLFQTLPLFTKVAHGTQKLVMSVY